MDANVPKSRIAQLDLALASLEAAVTRVASAEKTRADLVDTLAIMDDDRQRLATDLDAALARANRLADASEIVERRLDAAGAKVAALLRAAGTP